MQIKLTIVVVAAVFALARLPALAVEMPLDGTKNFSAPGDAPSYFTNENVPESARVANPATFTHEDVAAIPEGTEVGPGDSARTETRRHGRHASAHGFGRHASGKSQGHGASIRYERAPARAPKTGPTRHAKTNTRQHAAAVPPPGLTPNSVG